MNFFQEKKKKNQKQPIERLLLSDGKNSTLKRDLQRYENLRKEMENCTFQPKTANKEYLLEKKLFN